MGVKKSKKEEEVYEDVPPETAPEVPEEEMEDEENPGESKGSSPDMGVGYILVTAEGDQVHVFKSKNRKDVLKYLEGNENLKILGLYKGREIPLKKKMSYVI